MVGPPGGKWDINIPVGKIHGSNPKIHSLHPMDTPALLLDRGITAGMNQLASRSLNSR